MLYVSAFQTHASVNSCLQILLTLLPRFSIASENLVINSLTGSKSMTRLCDSILVYSHTAFSFNSATCT